MRINTNVPALQTHTSLLNTNNRIATATQRLASGIKLSSASDDAAGRAIANKLTLQTLGLAKASRNASSGISILQTAEGAMNEIHTLLQRMNELAVKAANGTNEPEDCEKMQMEINQLRDEIDGMSVKIEYNKIKVLGSEADRIVDLNITRKNVDVLRMSDTLLNGNYQFTIPKVVLPPPADPTNPSNYVPDPKCLATQTTLTPVTVAIPTAPNDWEFPAGKMFINDIVIYFDGTESPKEAYEKVRDAAAYSDITVLIGNPNAGYPVFTSMYSNELGSKYEINITGDDKLLRSMGIISAPVQTTRGQDIKIQLVKPSDSSVFFLPSVTTKINTLWTDNVTYTADGNRVTITDINGRELCFDVNVDISNKSMSESQFYDPSIPLVPLEKFYLGGGFIFHLAKIEPGPMVVQIGASKNMEMKINIPKINSATLELDKINIQYPSGAQRAIGQVAKAIDIISNVRAKMGAYQNRLEATISNLDTAEFNMNTALSRIVDTDMAEEMTKYAKDNVLYQAGISVLAQANQRPQSILQLLG